MNWLRWNAYYVTGGSHSPVACLCMDSDKPTGPTTGNFSYQLDTYELLREESETYS